MTELELENLKAEVSLLNKQVASLVFQDSDKEIFRVELITLTEAILAETIPTVSVLFDAYESYVKLMHLWNSLTVLSNENRLNEEMKYCILKLIETWDPGSTSKIVLFTLGDFGINKQTRDRTTKAVEGLLHLCKTYGVSLSKEPVFILVPDQFKDHVLSNVSLYHEVGHFIEKDNAIMQTVLEDIEIEIENKPTARILRDYFPFAVGNQIEGTLLEKMKDYISEYIADLFGSIYLNEHILSYVSYGGLANPHMDYDDHPSYNHRLQLIKAFSSYSKYGSTQDHLLHYIIRVFDSLSGSQNKIGQGVFSIEDYQKQTWGKTSY